MAKVIPANTRLEAWLAAVDYLMGRKFDLNLILDIKSPGSDGPRAVAAYKLMDAFSSNAQEYPIHTVAETIFPGWEYSRRGIRGVFENYPEQFDIVKSRWGTYAHRMIRRQTATGKIVNPLEQLIAKMRGEFKNPGPKRACYELGLAEGAYDVPLYNTTDDASPRMGLPCLSHLSFKLADRQVHLTALYRSHDYSFKVPGNLLGLARLQACVAREVGAGIGGLVVHSTYASLRGSKTDLKNLVADLGELNAQKVGK